MKALLDEGKALKAKALHLKQQLQLERGVPKDYDQLTTVDEV